MDKIKAFTLRRVFSDRQSLAIASFEVKREAEGMRDHIQREFPSHRFEIVEDTIQT